MLTPQDTQKLQKAGYNDAQIHAYEVKKFGIPDAPVQKSNMAPIAQGGKDLLKMFVDTGKQTVDTVKESGIDAGKQLKDAYNGKAAPLAALHIVGDIAKTAISPLTSAFNVAKDSTADLISDAKPLQKVTNTPVADKAANVQQQISDKLDEIRTNHPEAVRSVEDLINIASLFAPEKIKEEVGVKPSLKGGLVRETSPISPSTSTEALSAKLSRKLYEVGIGRNTAEAERTLNYRSAKQLGENPTAPTTRATVAQKYGIAGRQADIGVQAKTTGTKLYQDQILPALEKSTEVITKNDLFKPIEEKIANTVDPSRKAELQDSYEALQEDYKNKDTFSLKEAQQLKSELDKFTPDKAFKGKPIANAFNELRHDMADTIRAHTYEKLSDEGIKQKYLDYGNLKELQKLGVEGLANNKLKGGAGSFLSGLYEKAVTPITTGLGKVLYKVEGTPITFKGEPGIKTFKGFLESHGYDTRNFNKGSIANPFAEFDYGKVVRGIDNTDANLLNEYADTVGQGKKPSPELSKKVQNTLDYFGTPGRFGKQGDVFKDVTNILDARRQSLK